MAWHTHHHAGSRVDPGGEDTHDGQSRHADLLDLDAEVFGPYLDELIDGVRQRAPAAPRRIADVGAGTGAGALALARRFPAAEIVAVDRSAVMLDRLHTAARLQGLGDRLRVVQADLDAAWPAVGAVDVAWAASSLHHVADPDRVLRDIHAALKPGGLLVVVETGALPRFLPDDIGLGRPGLEARCQEAAARAGWNAYPDWTPHLERAGFGAVEQCTFTVEVSPAPPAARRYAHAVLRGYRSALADHLAADDLDTLDTLDHLLAGDHPDALVNGRDLTVRGSRTAWSARRP